MCSGKAGPGLACSGGRGIQEKTFAFLPPRWKMDLYLRKILKHSDPPPITNELLMNLKRATPKGSDSEHVLSASAAYRAGDRCRSGTFFYFPVSLWAPELPNNHRPAGEPVLPSHERERGRGRAGGSGTYPGSRLGPGTEDFSL